MHHNGQTIQTIEALIRLARGTLDTEGIAELRRQLAPHEQAAEAEPEEKRFHIIHTSNGGPVLVSFDCEDDRAEWCEKQDDTFETFIAVDGLIHNVLTPNIGE